MKKTLLLFLLLFSLKSFSQEILADVNVDFSQIQTSNSTTFTQLQKNLKSFINNTRWTKLNLKKNERIQANFTLVISKKLQNNLYQASLLVQSRRPVYHSGYYTPILNINDTDFSFKYIDFQPLIFNERKFSGTNLTDVIAFYIYYIIGADADSFKMDGGNEYYKIAEKIVNNAQNQNFSGWSKSDGNRNRFSLINETLSASGQPIRICSYKYHRIGLDNMFNNLSQSKINIGESLMGLGNLIENSDYTQNYLLDNFFQAKKEEIVDIFSDGEKTSFSTQKLKSLLNKISPTNTDDWEKMSK